MKRAVNLLWVAALTVPCTSQLLNYFYKYLYLWGGRH